MAYNNYLLKVGGITLPASFIAIDTYEVTPNQIMDKDSYRDDDGKLHRTTVSNSPSKITFQTKIMTETQLASFRSFLGSQTKVSVKFWCPDTGDYKTEYMYRPDVQFKIYSVASGEPIYKPATITFVGY